MLGLTETQIAVCLFATLAAAFVRGLAGFGMAILLVPVLALAVAPAEAVVVANWLGLMIGLVGLKKILGASEKSAFQIAALAMLATPLGVWLLALIDPAVARLGIALIALGSFVLVLLPKRPEHHAPSTLETGATGLTSGILTGFAGMPGPPVVPYYLRRQIPAELARASMMTIFLACRLCAASRDPARAFVGAGPLSRRAGGKLVGQSGLWQGQRCGLAVLYRDRAGHRRPCCAVAAAPGLGPRARPAPC
jgi:uncharacterized membrane protein YfcA